MSSTVWFSPVGSLGARPRFDYYFLSGTLTVRNSSFNNALAGVGEGGFLKNIRVTVGGSHSSGNIFENVAVGIDMESAESSVTEISYNRSSGIWNSMWVVPWETPSSFPVSRLNTSSMTTPSNRLDPMLMESISGTIPKTPGFMR